MTRRSGPGTGGALYRPSNGTEGELFQAEQCGPCRKRSWCKIILRSHAYDVDHPSYPRDLLVGADGWGYCARRDTGRSPPRGRNRSRRQLNFDSLLVQAPAPRAIAGAEQFDAHCWLQAMGQAWRIVLIPDSGLAYVRTPNGLGAADIRLRPPAVPARLEEIHHAAAA